VNLPDPQDERPDGESDEAQETERGLAGIRRPMDDPQTRPALDPEAEPPEVI
jgi:hypothetical protein